VDNQHVKAFIIGYSQSYQQCQQKMGKHKEANLFVNQKINFVISNKLLKILCPLKTFAGIKTLALAFYVWYNSINVSDI
ncbi:MAG: hypothetical protein J5517_06980, partial [Eubacterium sp.]|nr:hypothetical protein [Eubacterium sp.]